MSQEKVYIEGTVSDTLSNPLNAVTVTVSTADQEMISYSISNSEGSFKLSFDNPTNTPIYLVAKSLGFEYYTTSLDLKENKRIYFHNIILQHSTEALDEVVIQSTRPIRQNKDTITYNIDYYTDDTERNVEDVLEKLPGLTVGDDGRIKYGNQEIKKILIDGDDLVDEQYTILSKNLDSKILENIQILKNYDENPLRKKYGEGQDIALNLTIKESKKNILFGKVALGSGTNERYDFQSNLGLLSGKLKTLNLNKLNNISDIVTPVPSTVDNSISSLNDLSKDRKLYNSSFINNEIQQPDFLEDEEILTNQSLFLSQSTNYKLNKNSTIRSLFYYSKDKIDFDQVNNTIYNVENPIFFQEDISITQKNPAFHNELDYEFYNQEDLFIHFSSKLHFGEPAWQQSIFLDEEFVPLIYKGESKFVNHHLRLTFQPNEGFLWENYLYQVYSSKNSVSEIDDIPLSNSDENRQNINQEKSAVGAISKLQLKINSNTFEAQVGVEQERNLLETSISEIDSLTGIRNIKFLNFFGGVGYQFQFKNKSEISTNLSLTYKKSYNQLKNFTLPEFDVSYQWSINEIGQFSLGYNFAQEVPDYQSIYEPFILTNYRTLTKGNEQLFKIGKHGFTLIHNKQILGKSLFIFNILSYTKFDKGIISTSFLSEDFNLVYFNIGKGGEFAILQNSVTTYISFLSSSFKVVNDISYYSNYLAINNNEIIKSKNYSINTSLESTTYVANKITLKNELLNNHQVNFLGDQKSSFNNIILKSKLSYKILEELNFSLTSNNYWMENANLSLLSTQIDYMPNDSDWNFNLQANNLLNEKYLISTHLNSYISTTTKTRIVPAYLLISAIYRF